MDDVITNKICAVIDAQGFVMDGHFFPREISVISNTMKQNVLCDTGLKRSLMNLRDRITNNYISNNILGMSFGSYNLEMKHKMSDDGFQVVRNIYEMVKTDKRDYVALRNDQLREILDLWKIPYIKLEDFGCPGINKLRKLYPSQVCHFHNRMVPDRVKLRCAEEKCEMLWRWLIDYWKLE